MGLVAGPAALMHQNDIDRLGLHEHDRVSLVAAADDGITLAEALAAAFLGAPAPLSWTGGRGALRRRLQPG